MRRLTAWLGGAASGIAAYRLLRRRGRPAAEPAGEPASTEPDARADELRAKLDESRATEPSAETVVEEQPPEPTADADAADEEPPEPESPDERRRRVHDEGRAALGEMRSE
jgi:hypothetical protein